MRTSAIIARASRPAARHLTECRDLRPQQVRVDVFADVAGRVDVDHHDDVADMFVEHTAPVAERVDRRQLEPDAVGGRRYVERTRDPPVALPRQPLVLEILRGTTGVRELDEMRGDL